MVADVFFVDLLLDFVGDRDDQDVGPGHDLAITTRINGSHMAGESKLATAGDTVWVDFWSPMSKYDNQPFACIAQAYPEGAQPGPMPGLPEVLVNPTAFPPPLVLFGDFLTPGGVNPWSVTLPSIGLPASWSVSGSDRQRRGIGGTRQRHPSKT